MRPIDIVICVLDLVLIWFVVAMFGEEGCIDSRGETMLPRWMRVNLVRAQELTERALKEGVEELFGSEDTAGAVA